MKLLGNLFAELNGFVLYDPVNLNKTCKICGTNNIFHSLTTTDIGDFVSEEGFLLPIFGLESDDYNIYLTHEENLTFDYLVSMDNYVLNVTSNKVNIVGVGYLSNIAMIKPESTLSTMVENGFYSVRICGFYDSNDIPSILYQLQKVIDKPLFNADLSKSFEF